MANCHNLFQVFNGNLGITATKKTRLITSRDNLRDKIRDYFKEKYPNLKPKFRGQGSYTMGTMIRTKNDTCDLDNGIYFFPKPDVTGTTIQKRVLDAVSNTTDESPQHRQRCIRVVYSGDYHIDLPVYYKESETNDNERPHLAVKNEDWSPSDPKEFKDWFNKIKDPNGQLVRTVRYLKAWCDNRSKKMPNGLTMTVLASNHIKYSDRDDDCLLKTLEAIELNLKMSWQCTIPTTPQDDLLEDYQGNPDNFFQAISNFISDAKEALDEKNQLKASKKWQKHLGNYFPEGADKNVDAHSAGLTEIASNILTGNARLDKSGTIQKEQGVEHKPHRNYGGYD